MKTEQPQKTLRLWGTVPGDLVAGYARKVLEREKAALIQQINEIDGVNVHAAETLRRKLDDLQKALSPRA